MRVEFETALAATIEGIPPGRVASCGVVARALGDVRAARAVAHWIAEHPQLDPERQVVRADGGPVAPESPRKRREKARANRFVARVTGVPILSELRTEQRRLAGRVREIDEPLDTRTLGGVDASYVGDQAFAAAVLLDAESLDVLEVHALEVPVRFPYIPSYLAYREFPVIREILAALEEKPDVLFIDGHGRLHPAGFGLACFAGVSLNLPTIGVAKHLLVGRVDASKAGATDAVPVRLEGILRGYAWRPPRASRPLYVSVGHRLSLERALAVTQSATRERYPEPLRQADRVSKEEKRKKKGEGNGSEGP